MSDSTKRMATEAMKLTGRQIDFTVAANDKFERKAIENDRSFTPWNDHELPFLMDRLIEEVTELIDAYKKNDPDNIKDESLDVANFAWFVYEKAQKMAGGKKNDQ
jgi:NTP pyrophosphatase (non-canonical NTP hydrolase)